MSWDRIDKVGQYATDPTFLKAALTTNVVGFTVLAATQSAEIAAFLGRLG